MATTLESGESPDTNGDNGGPTPKCPARLISFLELWGAELHESINIPRPDTRIMGGRISSVDKFQFAIHSHDDDTLPEE